MGGAPGRREGSIPSEPEERESSFPEPRGGHGPEADCQAGCANELADGIRVDNTTDRWNFPTTLRARVDFTSNASRARVKRHFSFSACESQGRCRDLPWQNLRIRIRIRGQRLRWSRRRLLERSRLRPLTRLRLRRLRRGLRTPRPVATAPRLRARKDPSPSIRRSRRPRNAKSGSHRRQPRGVQCSAQLRHLHLRCRIPSLLLRLRFHLQRWE